MYIWLNTIQGGVLTPETPPCVYDYMYYITKTINDNGINKNFLSKRMKRTGKIWDISSTTVIICDTMLVLGTTENFRLTFH